MTDREKIDSQDYYEILLDYEMIEGEPSFAEGGVVLPIERDLNIVYARKDQISMKDTAGIIYRSIPKAYTINSMQNGIDTSLYDPGALIASGILRVQGEPLNLKGRGVVLGFLDTGIRYQEGAFRREDGSTRILGIWDQTAIEGTPPEGLPYGAEYKREEIDLALSNEDPLSVVPVTDEGGHGTEIASVAAGGILGGGLRFNGAAPEADIAVVKLRGAKEYLREMYLLPDGVPAYSESDLITAVRYLESYAIALKRPLVICMCLGTNQGNHAGQSILADYLNRIAARRSRAVVVGGGNEGNSNHHYVGYAAEGLPETVTNVEIRVDSGETGFVTELWGSVMSSNAIAIRAPGGEITRTVTFKQQNTIRLSFVYEKTVIDVDHVLVEQGSGEEMILFRFYDPSPGIWSILVTTTGARRAELGNFHIWLPMKEFLNGNTYFLEPSPYVTLTEPANTQEVITTTYYLDSNNSFYGASGRGFARNGTTKPELCTPGVNIPTILGTRTGCAMGAALLSGICAQFMEWAVVEGKNPWVESRELKNYLIRGAVRSLGSTYPSREWGYGQVNIAETFDVIAGV